MAIRNPVSEWGELAEAQGWKLIRTRHSVQWLPPGGGSIVTTPAGEHTAPGTAMANAKRALARAGLVFPVGGAKMPRKADRADRPDIHALPPLLPDGAEPEATEAPEAATEPYVSAIPLTPDDVGAALDAAISLVAEEIGALRQAHEELVNVVDGIREELVGHAAKLARVIDLGAKLEQEMREESPVAYVTEGDLRRAVNALQEAMNAAIARVDPLANMRAKMRGAAP